MRSDLPGLPAAIREAEQAGVGSGLLDEGRAVIPALTLNLALALTLTLILTLSLTQPYPYP